MLGNNTRNRVVNIGLLTHHGTQNQVRWYLKLCVDTIYGNKIACKSQGSAKTNRAAARAGSNRQSDPPRPAERRLHQQRCAAKRVNLSPAACLRRVERLKAAKVIRGTVALLDPQAMGAGTVVLIGVVLDRSTPESFAAFEKAAQNISGCMECHLVTGEFDYFLLIRTRDSESFTRLHAEQLLYLPGVRQVRSFMGLKEVVSRAEVVV